MGTPGVLSSLPQPLLTDSDEAPLEAGPVGEGPGLIPAYVHPRRLLALFLEAVP